jgi:hypothetical protein
MSLPSYLMFATHTISSAGLDWKTDGKAASSTNTYYSKKFAISDTNAIGFRLKTSGTLTGTFTLQYSDKDNPDETSDTDWDEDTSWASGASNPAGSTTSRKYAVTDIRGKWWRIKYVNASGTGNLYGYAAGSDV